MRNSFILILIFLVTSFGCDETVPANPLRLHAPTNLTENSVADGKTFYQFTVQIDPQSKDEFKTVTLTCTDGKFAGETTSKTRVVKVDNMGIADSIYWQVPKNAGTYFISASIGNNNNLYNAEVKVTLKKDNVVPTISITPEAKSLAAALADGVSIVILDIVAANNTQKSVTVTTNEGFVTDGLAAEDKSVNIKLDDMGVGTAQLRLSNVVKLYTIKTYLSAADSVYKIINMTPNRAYADNIKIEPSSLNIEVGSFIQLDIYLSRSSGLVSVGTPITYRAYQMVNEKQVDVGRFTGLAKAVTDIDQKVSLTFHADTDDFDSDFNKRMFIEIKTKDQSLTDFPKIISLKLISAKG